jgi:uncharacterized membrane protein
MTTTMETRQLALLAAGFAASVLAATGVFGPYHAWDGQWPAERLLAIFLFPTTATVIAVLLQSLLRRHVAAGGNGDATAAAQSILFWVIAFLIGVHGLMLAVMTGVESLWPYASRAVVVMLGITLMAVGNLLPRTRPNLALGIRTARTLMDRQLWVLTHRVSGYVLVGVGIVTVFSGLSMSGPLVPAAPGLAVLAGALIVAAYYLRVSRA